MSSLNVDIGNALDKIKLGNSFLLFGALTILTSIAFNHNQGLKLGIILFLSGSVFRITNIILNKKIIKNYRSRFIIWMILLCICIFLIIKYVLVF